MFGIVTGLLSPRSRGSLRLRSADPTAPPRIDPAYQRHPDDLARMVAATQEARRISRTAPLADLIPGPEINPGHTIDDADDVGLARSIHSRVSPYHHPVGTCAMGPDPDTGAVVTERGAVHGIDRLWVADASIMPTIVGGNTNAPVIMIADKAADLLLGRTIAP